MSYEKLEVTRGLMEAYVSMNAPQAENILEEVEQIDEKMTGLQAGGGNAAVQAAMRKDPNLSPIDAKLGVLKKGQAELNRQQTASQTAAARNTSSGQVQVSSNPIVRTFGGGQEKFKRDSSGNLTLDRKFNPRQGTGTNDLEKSIRYGGQSYDRKTVGDKVTYVRRGGTQPAGSSNPPAGASNPPAGANNPPAGAKTAPASSTVLAKQGGVEGKLDKSTGKFTAGSFTDTERQRYVTRGGSSTPSAPKPPAIGTLGSTSFERRTPTSTELKAAQSAREVGASPEKALQAAKMAGAGERAAATPTTNQTTTAFKVAPLTSSAATAATTKPVAPEVKATNTAAAAPAPVTVNPSSSTKPEDKTKNQPVKEDQDLFDVILEHLLEEGFAETQEAAITIMANMGEEWRDSIVEAKYGTKAGRKALAKKVRAGKNIGKKGPGTGFKAVEKAAEKGGAEDPKAVAAAAMWKTYGGKKGKGKTQKEW